MKSILWALTILLFNNLTLAETNIGLQKKEKVVHGLRIVGMDDTELDFKKKLVTDNQGQDLYLDCQSFINSLDFSYWEEDRSKTQRVNLVLSAHDCQNLLDYTHANILQGHVLCLKVDSSAGQLDVSIKDEECLSYRYK